MTGEHAVAVIVAAGKGSRMGENRNKLLLPLGTSTILETSLEPFLKHSRIRKIYLAASLQDLQLIKKMIPEEVFLVEGGKRRQDSVHNALVEVMKEKNIKDYKSLINELNSNLGSTTLDFRKKMAQKAFTTTANYDSVISNWLNKNKTRYFKIKNHKKINLRYGENPNQKSFFYKNKSKKTFFDNILQGKKISYNNILDIDSAINCLNEFSEPTCIIIKHNNPCGVSSCKRILSAYKKAHLADPISAFGGIVALNRLVTLNLAKQISNNFYEIIIANNFTKPALKIFSKKKNLIIIKSKNLLIDKKLDIKSINGGYVFQDKNLTKINLKNIYCVSNKKAPRKTLEDLIFSFRVCKHVKSNSIVLAKNKQTIGIGAGQMSRVDATKLSLMKASNHAKKIGFVAASDAFFPFTDNLKLLIKNNCKSIIQPKGSVNDNKTIKCANSYRLPLYFSNYRFFKH